LKHLPEMRIPDIRDRMVEIADARDDVPADVRVELKQLAEATRRRITKRTTRVVAKGVTPELARDIREYVRQFPQLTYFEIGRKFGIPGGRVSEVMHGRKGERPAAAE
jgi:chromosome condensin MukBEF complex kleisin-like MukF subunit